MSALQHREAGPPATAELFSDLLSNNTLCASGAACLPRQQRSIQHFSATPWLNVIAPAVWAPQRSRPCIRLQSLNSSDVDGCLFPGVIPRMVAWVMHGQRTCYRDVLQHLQPSERLRPVCAARHFLLVSPVDRTCQRGSDRSPVWFLRHRPPHFDA